MISLPSALLAGFRYLYFPSIFLQSPTDVAAPALPIVDLGYAIHQATVLSVRILQTT